MEGPDTLWELVFLMVILKIPIAYLCYVVWYAIKAEPRGRGGPAGVRASPDSPPPARPPPPRARVAARRARTAARPASTRAPRARPLRAPIGSPTVERRRTKISHRTPVARRPAETVAGYLSALAIFVSVVGLAWHPLRLILPSLAIALVAAGMGRGKGRLQFAAVMICAACFFLGLTIAVAISKPLW